MKWVPRTTSARLATGMALLAVICGVIFFSPVREMVSFEGLVSWVEHSRRGSWTRVGFYLFFVLGMLGLPITLFPIIGGVLCQFWIAFPLNVLATTTGACLAFGIARFFGRGAVEPLLRGRLHTLDEIAASKGFRTVFLIRWFGVPPFAIANYLLGLSHVRFGHFIVGTVLGMLPWMALITYAASSLWEDVVLGGKKGLVKALWSSLWPLSLLSGTTLAMLAVVAAKKMKREPAEPAATNGVARP